VEFLYAAELKKRYTCYGHFYELTLSNGEQVKCRSVLEIVDGEIPQADPSAISLMVPDVVVIMMNPGSSRPKNPDAEPELFDAPLRAGAKPLVLTQPDNTQYQIMRVAVEKNWHHIRILNLSDLRDPKSGSFIQKADECAALEGGGLHSLFCEERTAERSQALTRKSGAPILLGWGQDAGLLPLVDQCLSRIHGERFYSVASPVDPRLNAHPSPMMQKAKVAWLENILAELGK
jgi:hypothetical protein